MLTKEKISYPELGHIYPGDYYEAQVVYEHEFDEDGLVTLFKMESDYAGDGTSTFDWMKDSSGRPTSVVMINSMTGDRTNFLVETDGNGNIVRLVDPQDSSSSIDFTYQLVEHPSINAAAQNGVFDITSFMGATLLGSSSSSSSSSS